MTMLLDDKRLLITGVLTEASIAYSVARLAQEQGAELVLTGFGRALRITERIAHPLPDPPDVLELDVTQPEHLDAVASALGERWGRVDGVVHAIGFAPQAALGGGFLSASWEDVGTAMHVSTYSFAEMGRAFGPLLAKAGGGRSSGWTSTPRSHGPPTTGWGSRRRAWSRAAATSPATSARRGRGSTWSPRARCARWRRSRSRASCSSMKPGPAVPL